jgi:hypothetical protein
MKTLIGILCLCILMSTVQRASAQPACSIPVLNSQCFRGDDNCQRRGSACFSQILTRFSRQCLNGTIDPGTAATRVSAGCDACRQQFCR